MQRKDVVLKWRIVSRNAAPWQSAGEVCARPWVQSRTPRGQTMQRSSRSRKTMLSRRGLGLWRISLGFSFPLNAEHCSRAHENARSGLGFKAQILIQQRRGMASPSTGRELSDSALRWVRKFPHQNKANGVFQSVLRVRRSWQSFVSNTWVPNHIADDLAFKVAFCDESFRQKNTVSHCSKLWHMLEVLYSKKTSPSWSFGIRACFSDMTSGVFLNSLHLNSDFDFSGAWGTSALLRWAASLCFWGVWEYSRSHKTAPLVFL